MILFVGEACCSLSGYRSSISVFAGHRHADLGRLTSKQTSQEPSISVVWSIDRYRNRIEFFNVRKIGRSNECLPPCDFARGHQSVAFIQYLLAGRPATNAHSRTFKRNRLRRLTQVKGGADFERAKHEQKNNRQDQSAFGCSNSFS